MNILNQIIRSTSSYAELQDKRTLSDYRIKNETTIHLSFRY